MWPFSHYWGPRGVFRDLRPATILRATARPRQFKKTTLLWPDHLCAWTKVTWWPGALKNSDLVTWGGDPFWASLFDDTLTCPEAQKPRWGCQPSSDQVHSVNVPFNPCYNTPRLFAVLWLVNTLSRGMIHFNAVPCSLTSQGISCWTVAWPGNSSATDALWRQWRGIVTPQWVSECKQRCVAYVLSAVDV